MSTRVFLNGRVFSYGIDAPPLGNAEFPQPFGVIHMPDPNYTDGAWGLRYRVIERANDSDQWMTMPEVTKLLHVKDQWVVAKVHKGQVDAAMIRGSTIPLFRLRDKASIVNEAILDRAPEKVSQRPKKDRWDRE